MKKRCILFLLFVVIISSFLYHYKSSNYESLDLWIGEYRYTESVACDGDDTEGHVYYEITIWKQKNKYYAIVQDDSYGFSMGKAWSFAAVSGDENIIDIIFLQTLAWDDLYGVKQRYEKGEILLQLERNGQEIITTWGAMQDRSPNLRQGEDTVIGSYFQKEEPCRGT